VITDHWAIGTPRTMVDYAAQALPYTENCCEGYVWENLANRCYSRSEDVLKDEFADVDAVRKLGITKQIACLFRIFSSSFRSFYCFISESDGDR
jgi:hypothetical protein